MHVRPYNEICVAMHRCWRASFLAFCRGGQPAIYTIAIPYLSIVYSMYTYNYLHVWRAARKVKTPPADNYVAMKHEGETKGKEGKD